MKKYFFGLIAIIGAISFSAFKAPMASTTFLLTSDPTAANIVSLQSDWINSGGQFFGACSATPEDLACSVKLQTTTMSAFYHNNGTADVLNTRADAIAAGVGARYLEIQEVQVGAGRYKISTILAKQIVNVGGTLTDAPDNTPVIAKQQSLSSGVDVAYFNAKFQ
jgi:hypothetical protein